MSQANFVVEGVRINCFSLQSAIENIIADCKAGASFGVFTLNLDHVVKLRRNGAFRAAYRNARYVTADGFPIVWAGRLLGTTTDRVTGSDLIEPLCDACARDGVPIYLFGSSFEALAGAARHLAARFPNIEIVGVTAPEQGFEPASELAVAYGQRIARSGAKMCFVALGAPKQELFVATTMAEAPGTAFVCIGAGIDYLAGVEKRAPRWAQSIGTEWLWRLLSSPRRLGPRYLNCVLVLPRVLVSALAARLRTTVAAGSDGSLSRGLLAKTGEAASGLDVAKADQMTAATVSAQDPLARLGLTRPNDVLLTVSGVIARSTAEDIAQQRRPRADYFELARTLEADLLDHAAARRRSGRMGRAIERIAGPNVMLAYACWRDRGRYQTILTDGEQVGIPLAALFRFTPGARPLHVMISHVISARKKTLIIDLLRLRSCIDTFVVYSSLQQSFLRSKWRMSEQRTPHISFMVDENFFDPARVVGRPGKRPRICAVGLERRDYDTLLSAVAGLDVDVIIAAASPWSKQTTDVNAARVPPNVTVRKFTQYELRQLYADCDFMVMPLQPVDFQAGVTAILEAMAMGKPVICSAAPGQTDVLVDGQTGRYVPVGSPEAMRAEILSFISNPDEVRRLGANARTAVLERFGLQQYADRIRTIVRAPEAGSTMSADRMNGGVTQRIEAISRSIVGARQMLHQIVAALRARWYLRSAASLGDRVRVWGRPAIRNEGTLIVGERARFVSTTAILELGVARGATLTIGAKSFINYGCSIAANCNITIGPRCNIGTHVVIMDNDYHELDPERRHMMPPSAPIFIGENVWIGTRAIILRGVTIGDGSVIGAGSVVTRDVPPRSVAVGQPARVVRTL